MKKTIDRRKFIKDSALTAAAFTIVPSHVLGGKRHVAPSDKLYIACVGCGGEAQNDIEHFAYSPKKNAVIAFLCDVDDVRSAETRKNFPKAPYYHDWREMFDKEHKNFDAVTVAIPEKWILNIKKYRFQILKIKLKILRLTKLFVFARPENEVLTLPAC